MSDISNVLAEAKSAEAIQAASVHAEAVERAREAQLDDAVARGLDRFFSRGIEDGRFIPLKRNRMADVERFQFICDQIDAIHEKQKTQVTKEDFILVRNIVFGFIGIIVLAFMAALTAIVFK